MLAAFGLIGQLGLIVVLAVLGCLAGGWFVGEHLGAPRAGTVIGTLIGVVAGVSGAARLLLRDIDKHAKRAGGRRDDDHRGDGSKG